MNIYDLDLTMYVQKAVRISQYDVSENVKEVYPGQLFHLDENGQWDYADGTKKAYPTLNSRFKGTGYDVLGGLHEGRDDVSRNGKLACLASNFEIPTFHYDKDVDYVPGTPLVAGVASDGTKGVVLPFEESTHKQHQIVGFVTGVPSDDEEPLYYQG